MKPLIAVFLFLFSAGFLLGDEIEDHCGPHPNIMRDSSGKLLWHSVDQMKRLTATEVPAEKPRLENLVYTGVVSFRVLVGTTGNVLCMWDAAGHPMMIPGAARALHEWKFKPQARDGKQLEYVGKVNVPVSNK